MLTHTVHLVAHRGMPVGCVENTLESVKKAVLSGAKYIEVDIQVTADLQLIVFHDACFSRLGGSKQRTHQLSYQQMRFLPLRDAAGNQSPCVTLLSELLQWLGDYSDVTLFLEIKPEAISQLGMEDCYRQLDRLLQQYQTRTVFISFDAPFMNYVLEQGRYRTGLVLSEWQTGRHAAKQIKGLSFIFCNHQHIPQGYRHQHDDIEWVIYEVGSLELAEQLIEKGFYWLETFDFERLNAGMLLAHFSIPEVASASLPVGALQG